MSIFSLVEDVLVSILVEWTELKDLSRLDSATCNSNDRLMIFHLIKTDGSVFNGTQDVIFVPQSYLVWLGLRSVTVSRLRICDIFSLANELFTNNHILLFKLKCLKIEGVRFDLSWSVEKAAQSCPLLEEFVIRAPLSNVDAVVSSFVQHCLKLTVLTVDRWSLFSDIRNDFFFVKSHGDSAALTSVGMRSILQHGHNLTELNLCNHEILSIEPSDLNISVEYTALSKLTHLDVGHCSLLTDESIRLITRNCNQLVEFDIHLCPEMGDAALVFVASRNHSLRVVNLSCVTKITDIGLLALSRHCPEFVAGNFNGLNITDTSMVALAQNCPKMARVTLKMNADITDLTVQAITQHLPDYESIGLGSLNMGFFGAVAGLGVMAGGVVGGVQGFVSLVTAPSLSAMVMNCNKMHTFDLSNCSDIDSTVRLISERCPLLKRLFITKSCGVAEDTMLQITQRSPELILLEAPRCICMTDATLSSLVQLCPKLVWLDVSCTHITDVGVLSIAEHAKNLSILDIDWCRKVTSSSVVEITVKCPLLVKLHCCPVKNSTVILLSLVENCPFIMDISVCVDADVSDASYHATCKKVASAFPRVHFSSMKILGSSGFMPNA